MKHLDHILKKRLAATGHGNQTIGAIVLGYLAELMTEPEPYEGYIKHSTLRIRLRDRHHQFTIHRRSPELIASINDHLRKHDFTTRIQRIKFLSGKREPIHPNWGKASG